MGLLLAVSPVTASYTVTAGAVVGGTSGMVPVPVPVPCVDALLGVPKLGQTHLGQVCSATDLTDFRINGISLFDSRTQRTLKYKSLKISEQVTVNPNTCSFTLEGKGRDVETNTLLSSHNATDILKMVKQGDVIYTVGATSVRAFNATTYTQLWSTAITAGQTIAVSPINSNVAIGCSDGRVLLFSNAGVLLGSWDAGPGHSIGTGGFSLADNKLYMPVSGTGIYANQIVVFDTTLTTPPPWPAATTLPSPAPWALLGAAYGTIGINKRVVAVGAYNGSYNMMFSVDNGRTWGACAGGGADNKTGVAFGNNRFISVGVVGSNYSIYQSIDGITWSLVGMGLNGLYAITYGGGLFVAVGQSGTILTSPDGITWTPQTSGTARDLYGVTYGGGLFVAVGNQGGGMMTILSSVDGVTWVDKSFTKASPYPLFGVTYGGGLYVVAGQGTSIWTSPDTTTWTERVPGGAAIGFRSAQYIAGYFMLGSNNDGWIYSSINGIAWTSEQVSGVVSPWPSIYTIIYDSGNYVAVGNGGSSQGVVNLNSTTSSNYLRYVQSFSARGTNPYQCLVVSNENELYISNQGSNNLVVLNYTTNTVVANISLSGAPRGLAYSARLNKVYIITSDGYITVIDGTRYVVMYQIPTYIADGYEIGVDDDTARAYITRGTSTNYPVIIANLLTRVVNNCVATVTPSSSSSVIVDRLNLKLLVASPSSNTIMEFQTFSQLGVLPLGESIIEIYKNSRLYFAGILTVPGKLVRLHHGAANDGNGYKVDCQAVDYSGLLQKTQLSKEYVNYYAGDIIRDVLVSSNVALQGFSQGNITLGPLLAYEKFDNQSAFDIIKAVAEKSYLNWDVDVYRKVSLTNPVATIADITIDETTGNFDGLTHEWDYSQMVNTVWVKGAKILTAGYSSEYVGDGSRTVFDLQDGPSGITCTVGGVSKTLGADNVDDPLLFDGMISFSNSQVTLKVAPGAGVLVHFSYSRYIPTTVRVTTSETNPSGFHSKTYVGALLSGNGQLEHTITADNATTLQAAIDAGKAHLLQFGRPILRGSFSSYSLSPNTGSYAKIKIFDRGLDEIVQINQKNTSILTHQKFVYQINFTSVQKDKYDALMQTLIKYTMPQTGFISETANIKLHPVIEEVVI